MLGRWAKQTAGVAALAAYLVANDGLHLWLTGPQHIVSNGAEYICTTSGNISSGAVEVHEISATGKVTHYAVETQNTQVDDHQDPAAVDLGNGRLFVPYQLHGDVNGTSYKISSKVTPVIGGFGKRRTITTGTSNSYAHFMVTSNGFLVGFRRDQGGTNYTQEMVYTTVAAIMTEDAGGAAATWTKQLLFNTLIESNSRAYAKYKLNTSVTTRIWVQAVSGHPSEVATVGAYGCYIDFATGAPLVYNLDGTPIVAAQPFEMRTYMTLLHAAPGDNTNKWWVQDIFTAASGKVRYLWSKYPSADSFNNNDIEYWIDEWTPGSPGSTVSWKVSSNNRSLFASQPQYCGGLCFDGNSGGNATPLLWLSEYSAGTGKYEIKQVSVNMGTGAVATTKTVPPGSAYNRIRPTSPIGYTAGRDVAWCSGQILGFTSFRTSCYSIGSITQPASPGAYDALTTGYNARCTTPLPVALKDALDRWFVFLKNGPVSGTNFFTSNKFGLCWLPIVASSQADAVRDFLNAARDLTLVNTGATAVWTTREGWKTGAASTTDWLQSLAPSAIPNYAQDNAHVSGFCMGQGTGGSRAMVRRVAGGVPTVLTPDSNSALVRVNGTPGVTNASTLTRSDVAPAFILGNRRAANELRSYLNGTQVGIDTTASAAPDVDPLTWAYQMTKGLAIGTAGAGLTDNEILDLNVANYQLYRELTFDTIG